MKKKIYSHNMLDFLLIVISIFTFLSFCHYTFNIDEEYSISLIEHGYKSLVNINTMDVHPPTYYVLLKVFVNMLDFNRSYVLSVIIARLFSIMSFIIAVIILHKIVNQYFYIPIYFQVALYVLFPAIGLYSTSIRMYSLYSMSIILEYFYLIKFDKNSRNSTLVLAVLFAVFASYIDYFSAVCAGIFLLIFLAEYIFKDDKNRSIKLIISCILYFIICIPLIVMVLQQVKRRVNNSFNKFPVNKSGILYSFIQANYSDKVIDILLLLVLLLPILLSLKYYKNNKGFNKRMLEVLINYILSLLLAVILCSKVKVFEYKFTYPQFSIYSFFVASIILIIIKNESNKVIKITLSAVIIFMLSVSINTICNNINNYIYPTFNQMYKYSIVNKQNVKLNYRKCPKNVPFFGKNLYITQEASYLKFYHKNLIITHCNPKYRHLMYVDIVNNNSKLFKSNFENIKFK